MHCTGERLWRKLAAILRKGKSVLDQHGGFPRGLPGTLRQATERVRTWGLLGMARRLWYCNGPDMPEAPLQRTCIQAHVAAYKEGRSLPSLDVRDVRIHVATEGNHFFQEIAALIQCGFSDIGIRAEVLASERLETCADAAHAQADLHLVVAPHEFFRFIPQALQWPHTKGLVWILNTEQAHTDWFARAKTTFSLADLMLDMDCELANRLALNGLRAEHLPLGFSPGCRLFDGLDPVEHNRGTAGLPRRIREHGVREDPLAEPLRERPLDCCFFGANTGRRSEFFARHAALFADLHCYLRLKPVTGPLRVGLTTPLSTAGTSSIVRRSKISLNVHQSEHRYFEWHRMVLQGIWQGTLVLSEPCTTSWPFRPNIDYLAVDLEDMADTLEYLLRSTEGQELAERVRRQAHATLTEQCRMGARLRELLQLHACVGDHS